MTFECAEPMAHILNTVVIELFSPNSYSKTGLAEAVPLNHGLQGFNIHYWLARRLTITLRNGDSFAWEV